MLVLLFLIYFIWIFENQDVFECFKHLLYIWESEKQTNKNNNQNLQRISCSWDFVKFCSTPLPALFIALFRCLNMSLRHSVCVILLEVGLSHSKIAVFVCFNKSLLTHFMPLVSFDTPWKHQKTEGFLMFSGAIEWDQWHEMGQKWWLILFISC